MRARISSEFLIAEMSPRFLQPNEAELNVTPERSVTGRLRPGAPDERRLPCGLGRRVTT